MFGNQKHKSFKEGLFPRVQSGDIVEKSDTRRRDWGKGPGLSVVVEFPGLNHISHICRDSTLGGKCLEGATRIFVEIDPDAMVRAVTLRCGEVQEVGCGVIP